MKKLHPTQEKLIELLKKTIGEPLTIRQIQEELSISSTSVVHHHIGQLEKKGYLKRNPSNPSDYQIVSDTNSQITYLNLYGDAQCGPDGSFLDGEPVERIAISTRMLGFPSSEAFLVTAKGDSMLPKFNEGDLIIAKKDSNPPDGSVIVCSNNGEILIKQLNKEESGVMLKSFNEEKYPPFSADLESFTIEGVVKGVLSFF